MHLKLFIASTLLIASLDVKAYLLPSKELKKIEAEIKEIERVQAVRTPTSAADQAYYRSLVPFALDAYCSDLQAGMRIPEDATVLWRGGDGNEVQITYVAYSPSIGIVVAHEGTNKTSTESIENDLRFNFASPLPDFEWLGPEVKIANSVQESWKETSDQVFEQVTLALQQYSEADITVTGHSLGASIALLDGLSLSHRLQKDIPVILFGLPRTGNRKFADAVNANLPHQRHIVFQRDVVPHLPSRIAGFRHPSGEVFIANDDGTEVYDCSGQENPNCSDSVLFYEIQDHSGPYFGVSFDKCSAQ